MRCAICLSVGIATLGMYVLARGDDQLAESSRLVSLEFVIAEFHSGKSLARKFEMIENPAERLAQLEREGRLASVARLQFTTLERYEGRVQIGEPRPVVAERPRTSATGRNSPGATKATFQKPEFGTTVAATPWVEKDGSVRIQMTAECSRYPPVPEKLDGVGDDALTGATTFSTKGIFRVPPGKSILLFGSQTAGQENARELLMVVSAQVAGARDLAAGDVVTDGSRLRIFRLRHLSAAVAAESVGQLLSEEGVRTTVDNRLNTLIVMGSVKMLTTVESLLQAMDVDQH